MLILFNSITETFHSILLGLDGWLYGFIETLYKVFLILSRITLFGEDDIAPFIRRVYMIIGVVMLFLLSYNLLTNIVNPEGKGKETAGKTIFNVVKAVILLALVPTIFDFAYQLQEALLSHNTIGKIIMGTGSQYSGASKTSEEILNAGGTNMALGVLQAFIVPTDNKEASETQIEGSTRNLQNVWDDISTENDFSILTDIAPASAAEGSARTVEYHYVLSTLAGFVVIYLLLSYCLALGIRVFKLAFYELIAPIPIMASIIPNKKDMLGKWISLTLTTFLEVFIRIAILYFAVYILEFVGTRLEGFLASLGVYGGLKLTIKAILIMGMLAFVKEAPKLIGDVLGIDSSNMSMGISERLKSGGAYAAGGFLAGMVAGRGNPLAGIRAARHAHSVGGLTGITSGAANEGAYRRSKQIAKAGGAGFWTRTAQGIRGYLGMESLGEKADRKIEEKDYTVYDQKGKPVVMDSKTRAALEQEKVRNTNLVSDIDRMNVPGTKASKSNSSIISHRDKIKAEAEKKTREKDSTITGTLYAEDGKTVVFSGNYDAMSEYIKQQTALGKISGSQIGFYNQQLKKQGDEITGRYVDGVVSGTIKNGTISDEYRDLLYDVKNGGLQFVKEERYSAEEAAKANEAQGRTDLKEGDVKSVSLASITEAEQAAMLSKSGWDLVESSRSRALDLNSIVSGITYEIEDKKSTIESRNQEIDRLSAQVDEQKNEAKQSGKYRAAQAASKIEKSKNGSFNDKQK